MINPYEPPNVDVGVARATPLKFTLAIGIALLVWFSLAFLGRGWFHLGAHLFGSFAGVLLGHVRSESSTLRSSYLGSFVVGSLCLFALKFETVRQSPNLIFQELVGSAVFAYVAMFAVTGCIALWMRLSRRT
jgi:predicted permease